MDCGATIRCSLHLWTGVTTVTTTPAQNRKSRYTSPRMARASSLASGFVMTCNDFSLCIRHFDIRPFLTVGSSSLSQSECHRMSKRGNTRFLYTEVRRDSYTQAGTGLICDLISLRVSRKVPFIYLNPREYL